MASQSFRRSQTNCSMVFTFCYSSSIVCFLKDFPLHPSKVPAMESMKRIGERMLHCGKPTVGLNKSASFVPRPIVTLRIRRKSFLKLYMVPLIPAIRNLKSMSSIQIESNAFSKSMNKNTAFSLLSFSFCRWSIN